MRGVQAEERLAVSSPRRNNLVNHTMLQPRISVVMKVDYALVARAVLRAERGKAHQAQFRYMKLKQQVNPHFLFNSLNILDCLVCEQRTEQAAISAIRPCRVSRLRVCRT